MQARHGRDPAQHRRAQHDPRQNLADHLGLPQPHEDIPQQLRKADKQQQDQDERG